MKLSILLLIFFNFFSTGHVLYSRNGSLLTNKYWVLEQNSKARLIYKDGFLTIEGLNGNANVSVYSIIGNQVAFFPNTELSNFVESVPLQTETMYIVRIEFSNTVFTYKFFTR